VKDWTKRACKLAAELNAAEVETRFAIGGTDDGAIASACMACPFRKANAVSIPLMGLALPSAES
jgi:hypothetical protein